jgi:beta-glucosidase
MINPTRLDRALGEIVGYAGQDRVTFAQGYRIGPGTDGDLESLRDEATTLAEQSDVVIIFLGLPAEEESEGFDRQHLELPADQTTLLDAVLAVNSRVIVVLSNGGVVRVSGWQHLVPGLIEGWLLGQAGGAALADVLFGAVNPSGRLAETIPFKLSDTPAYLDFPGQFAAFESEPFVEDLQITGSPTATGRPCGSPAMASACKVTEVEDRPARYRDRESNASRLRPSATR